MRTHAAAGMLDGNRNPLEGPLDHTMIGCGQFQVGGPGGRVVWQNSRRFGVQTQDRLNVSMVIAESARLPNARELRSANRHSGRCRSAGPPAPPQMWRRSSSEAGGCPQRWNSDAWPHAVLPQRRSP